MSSSSRRGRSDSVSTNNVDTTTNNDLDPNSILWKKLSVIAKATYLAIRGLSYSNYNHHNQHNHPTYISSSDVDTPLLLHAMIECGAPVSLVKLALQFHPDQIFMRDEVDGRTPLSIASAKVNANPEIISLLLGEEVEEAGGNRNGANENNNVNDNKVNKNQDENESSQDHHDQKHDVNHRNTFKQPTKEKRASIASMCDRGGRLPLHVALQSGRTYQNGVEKIANAAPLAMQTRDTQTGMYPFMLASIPNYRWDNTCIDTIYTMIRSVPHVMQRYCPDDDNEENCCNILKDPNS